MKETLETAILLALAVCDHCHHYETDVDKVRDILQAALNELRSE